MSRLVHHWLAPSVDGLPPGQPIRVRTECGHRSVLLTASIVAAWSRRTHIEPAGDNCPFCLAVCQHGDA